MTRSLFVQIDNELDMIDEYLVRLARKYGSFGWDGEEYVLIGREELDTDYDGRRIWNGKAFNRDAIHIEELVDDAEEMKDIDITIDSYEYIKDEFGELMRVESDYWYYWNQKDVCFEYKLNGYSRKVVA